MSVIRACLSALVLAVAGIPSLADPVLTWEVVNRFPILKDEAFARIQSQWDAGDRQTMVAHMTARLAAKDQRKIAKEEFLLADPRGETVPATQLFSDKERVLVSVELKESNAPCLWEPPSQGGGAAGTCRTQLSLPYGSSAKVRVSSAGRTFETTVEPRDIVIVSMGDSFSSGEGSPDRAALYADKSATPPMNDWFLYGPGPYEMAVWWDSPCHRSLLSWPVLATLKLALTQKHAIVRLVNVSCSGAEFMDGIFLAQKRGVIPADQDALTPERDGLPGSPPYGQQFLHRSQVNAVREVLCAHEAATEEIASLPQQGAALWRKCSTLKRAPDALVFTGGGNDAKFGAAVKGLLIPDRGISGKLLPKFVRQGVLDFVRKKGGAIPVQDLGDGAVALKKTYPQLVAAAAAGALVKPEQVLLVRYPDPIGGKDPKSKNGVQCWRPHQQERFLNAFMTFGPTARQLAKPLIGPLSRKIRWVAWIDEKELDVFANYSFPAVQAMLSDSGVRTVDWSASDPSLFAARVICAPVTNPDVPPVPTFFCNDDLPTECAKPFLKKKSLREVRFEAPGRMMVNSSNDALLGLRSWEAREPKESELIAAAGGAVHPTHEAHALAADSAYAELCKMLGPTHGVCSELP